MTNNYLYRNEILSGKKKFNDLFKNGKFVHGQYVNVIYNGSDKLKIGFAVSKRIKSSVKKNKLKRKLREIYRTNKIEFPHDKNIIILAKKDRVEFLDLKTEILSIIRTI